MRSDLWRVLDISFHSFVTVQLLTPSLNLLNEFLYAIIYYIFFKKVIF